METGIWVALIGATASLAVALVAAINSIRTERRRAINEVALKVLTDDFDSRKGLRDARRAYEFEARKRLYLEIEPLLYQSQEAARRLMSRVCNLAKVAGKGSLGAGENSWLGAERHAYYRHSLMHRLMLCWALHQLTSRRLTHMDQSLDPKIAARIRVQGVLYEMLSDHFDLAATSPVLSYQPNGPHPPDRMQGLALGNIDKAAEFIIVRNASGEERILELGAFEARLEGARKRRTSLPAGGTVQQASTIDAPEGIGSGKTAAVDEALSINEAMKGPEAAAELADAMTSELREGAESVESLSSRFTDFHPATHPVLWRSLVASACLGWVLTKLAEDPECEPAGLVARFFDSPKLREMLDWHGDKENDAKATDTPEDAILAAKAHILNRLRTWDPLEEDAGTAPARPRYTRERAT